ncbi:kinase-like domain-containing protein [Polychytrium aggregatum]|uniref:kinase-like domain-containing protein n=1 Tax=Polychytrium aggregatum TaxID=110093 RepID=UPI0022FE33AB|nr:kinase-like domain-containing protein [Polychytrium aggregatum]XP_052961947.1 kinase-like domain-containing protein [Polychytrium aggregatum]KAI9190657.1 kinase-like domain-containing protein [Polychytrium aggregatum]KAI9193009.1 kinase-like domain-containing protein [Polychytrium aggregatum]
MGYEVNTSNVLGKGGFGKVYQASVIKRRECDRTCALKLSCSGIPSQSLMREYEIYRELGERYNDRWPWVEPPYFQEGGELVLPMELLGANLESLRKQPLPDATLLCRLITETLNRLDELHQLGFVHRDIKPANFAFCADASDPYRVYLIDLGLTRNMDECQVQYHREQPFGGTVKYTSLATHWHINPTFKDDLISLGYMWVSLLSPTGLPWDRVSHMKKQTHMEDTIQFKQRKREMIESIKSRTTIRDLCQSIPSALNVPMFQFIAYCSAIPHHVMPDYDFLKSLFT